MAIAARLFYHILSDFRCSFLGLLFFLPAVSFSQNYRFTQYDIEKGLVQSQVLVSYQDKDHYMWFGTYGGLSRFDGKEFKSFTKADGLLNNVVTAVMKDRFGKVWVGTESGLSCIDGKKIRTFDVSDNGDRSWIRSMLEDPQGRIWFLRKSQLYRIDNSKIIEQDIVSDSEFVVSLEKNQSGKIYASVFGSGIYTLEDGKWQKIIQITDSLLITRIIPDKIVSNKYYLLTPNQIYISIGGKLTMLDHPMMNAVKEPLLSLEQDADGSIWVGTNNGAYYLHDVTPVHFETQNGFTNNAINFIHRDFEDNIWLASDGGGVFKFEGSGFKMYPQLNGNNHVIMSMARDLQDNLWMGGFTSGLLSYNGETFTPKQIPSSNPYTRNIVSMWTDRRHGLLIGTQAGLWSYSEAGYKDLSKNRDPQFIRTVITDSKGTIWIASPRGCFYMDSIGRPVPVRGIPFSGSALASVGQDSIIMGTNNGIFLIRNKVPDPTFRINQLKNTSVLSLLKVQDMLLVGTFGDGLFLIDLKSKKVSRYNLRNGLYSNDIYSIARDGNGVIWLGTGRGVNRIRVQNRTVRILEDASPVALIECNQNSMFYDGQSMWIGSNKALYNYSTQTPKLENKRPHINIQNFQIINQKTVNGKLLPSLVYTDRIPKNLELHSYQNRIFISFRGIYFTNPEEVAYQYRLLGIDEEFSEPLKANTIEYTSLVPGTYTFQVKAVVDDRESAIQTIRFTITPPFYKNLWFQFLVFVLFVCGIVFAQYSWNRYKWRKKKMLQLIKQEEQQKIRKQTAEDFHDDIGNKLTRISILSEMLNKRISDQDTEQKNLLQQIKADASTLYDGTKEILWALDPKSDNLYEVLLHIKDFGMQIFENTGVRYSFGEIDPSYQGLQLPMEYSRNISMIFKELLGNILKHAQARQVKVAILESAERLSIRVEDDGRGFDPEASHNGHGIRNIRMRVKRINGQVEMNSRLGEGSITIVTIGLKRS